MSFRIRPPGTPVRGEKNKRARAAAAAADDDDGKGNRGWSTIGDRVLLFQLLMEQDPTGVRQLIHCAVLYFPCTAIKFILLNTV